MTHRPDSPDWLAAKTDGDAGEMRMGEHYAALGWEVTRTIGRAAYDLLLLGRVEVKVDRIAVQSGQVAVEVSFHGQPSGILTTTAMLWTIVLEDEAIEVRVDVLRDAILRGRHREVSAGTSGAARVRLVPVDELRRLPGAHRIDLRPSGGAAW